MPYTCRSNGTRIMTSAICLSLAPSHIPRRAFLMCRHNCGHGHWHVVHCMSCQSAGPSNAARCTAQLFLEVPSRVPSRSQKSRPPFCLLISGGSILRPSCIRSTAISARPSPLWTRSPRALAGCLAVDAARRSWEPQQPGQHLVRPVSTPGLAIGRLRDKLLR